MGVTGQNSPIVQHQLEGVYFGGLNPVQPSQGPPRLAPMGFIEPSAVWTVCATCVWTDCVQPALFVAVITLYYNTMIVVNLNRKLILCREKLVMFGSFHELQNLRSCLHWGVSGIVRYGLSFRLWSSIFWNPGVLKPLIYYWMIVVIGVLSRFWNPGSFWSSIFWNLGSFCWPSTLPLMCPLDALSKDGVLNLMTHYWMHLWMWKICLMSDMYLLLIEHKAPVFRVFLTEEESSFLWVYCTCCWSVSYKVWVIAEAEIWGVLEWGTVSGTVAPLPSVRIGRHCSPRNISKM